MAEHWEQLEQGVPLYDEFGDVYGYKDMLKYDKLSGQFILTYSAVKAELNIDLETLKGTKTNGEIFLKELSGIIYGYIYKKKPAILREKTEYYLTYDRRNRRILYLAMVDMIRYALYSGGNIMGYQPGVNLNESDELNIEKLRNERMVSYVTDSLLKTNFLIDRNFVEYFKVPSEVEWRGV